MTEWARTNKMGFQVFDCLFQAWSAFPDHFKMANNRFGEHFLLHKAWEGRKYVLLTLQFNLPYSARSTIAFKEDSSFLGSSASTSSLIRPRTAGSNSARDYIRTQKWWDNLQDWRRAEKARKAFASGTANVGLECLDCGNEGISFLTCVETTPKLQNKQRISFKTAENWRSSLDANVNTAAHTGIQTSSLTRPKKPNLVFSLKRRAMDFGIPTDKYERGQLGIVFAANYTPRWTTVNMPLNSASRSICEVPGLFTPSTSIVRSEEFLIQDCTSSAKKSAAYNSTRMGQSNWRWLLPKEHRT